MEFANWLQNELNNRGWDQAELSRRSEITKAQISRVLVGDRSAGVDFCIAVARALGIPREEVFRARGWLLREPQQVVTSDADPRLIKMAEAVRLLPFEKREQILVTWGNTLKLAGVDYEAVPVDPPEIPKWLIPPEDPSTMPVWKRGLWTVLSGITKLDQQGRAYGLAKKYPIFKDALDSGRDALVLVDHLMKIGDALEGLPTRETREAYVEEWQDSDPDVYEIAKAIMDENGRLRISELK